MSIMSAKVHCHVDSEHYLGKNTLLITQGPILKVQIKCFFIAKFERAAKIRKIAVGLPFTVS